jgi:hypothetical protein
LEFQSLNAPFLEILRLMYPSPGNLKLMHLSPGNSKVNAPPPLEIPRFLNRGGADNNWNSPIFPQSDRCILLKQVGIMACKYFGFYKPT